MSSARLCCLGSRPASLSVSVALPPLLPASLQPASRPEVAPPPATATAPRPSRPRKPLRLVDAPATGGVTALSLRLDARARMGVSGECGCVLELVRLAIKQISRPASASQDGRTDQRIHLARWGMMVGLPRQTGRSIDHDAARAAAR